MSLRELSKNIGMALDGHSSFAALTALEGHPMNLSAIGEAIGKPPKSTENAVSDLMLARLISAEAGNGLDRIFKLSGLGESLLCLIRQEATP